MDAKHGLSISLSRVQLIMPDLTLGWSLNRQLSFCDTVCLFDRELVSLLIFQTLQFLRTYLYIFTAAALLQKKKKTLKTSYIMAISHVYPLTRVAFIPIIFICDGLNRGIDTFFKMPLQAGSVYTVFLPCEWSPANVLVNRQVWIASGVGTLQVTKSVEGQPDGQHQHTSCLNQPPPWGPASCFQ